MQKITSTLVRHAFNTSKYKPRNYDSWINFWKNKSNYIIEPNEVYDCPCCENPIKGSEFVGAHVKKVVGSNELYITPTCSNCNNPLINTDAKRFFAKIEYLCPIEEDDFIIVEQNVLLLNY